MLKFLVIVLVIYILTDGNLFGFVWEVLKIFSAICLILFLLVLIGQ